MKQRRKILLEEEMPGQDLFGLEKMSKKTKQSLDSVDDQLDSYIIRFESESIKDSSEDEIMMESLRFLNMRFLLEAEGDDPEGEAEAPASEPVGSDEPKEEPESVDPKPPLDIDAFTKKVARLVMNYKNLLRIEPCESCFCLP